VLVAAAVCPSSPLLVPALASGAAGELEELRRGCLDAVERLWAASPDVVYVVGGASRPTATSFAPWGVAEAVDLPEPLPLACMVGGWLTAGRSRSFVVVGDDLEPADCRALGAELATSSERVTLLLVGDGSARHSEKAPGYLDNRAAGFDDQAAKAFAAGDAAALAALDPDLADELLVGGHGVWQVLAGAAADVPTPRVDVSDFSAPYGVGYHLVTWEWQGRD
jgi:hypothetical protein